MLCVLASDVVGDKSEKGCGSERTNCITYINILCVNVMDKCVVNVCKLYLQYACKSLPIDDLDLEIKMKVGIDVLAPLHLFASPLKTSWHYAETAQFLTAGGRSVVKNCRRSSGSLAGR